MSQQTDEPDVELVTIPGQWNFGYTYFAGRVASAFFHELKNKRIMGSRCPQCVRVLVPARGFCDACYAPTERDLVEVGTTGTVETFTILTEPFPGLPEPPVVVALVLLEGSDSAVLNAVTGIDLGDLDAAAARLLAGMRVGVEFRAECEGRITDFHFVADLPGGGS
ncbi:Zn-ribbon domain-containing OB-fold protein [Sporichthya polymorpha]|uniref:Zn-ribbon domain-containing OB-fold protein n=1 Tax=Sporichthya polymorpha TaxID=35751 RepID=UPI00037AF933|nr:Zn-ribbon domain-containing OB-fold protein [Sporichthya polymorpha]